MDVPPAGGGRPSPPTARRRTSIRNSLSGNSERGNSTEVALERSAVAILILRVDEDSGPVLHRTVTAVTQKNPFVNEIIKEASPRLLECIPEKWASRRPRDEWVSLLKSAPKSSSSQPASNLPTSASGSAPYQPSKANRDGGGGSMVDNGAADIFYLAPRAVGVTDCSYFVLHLDKEQQEKDNGENTSPNKDSKEIQTFFSTTSSITVAGIHNRRRRIYGLCRRAPPTFPYAVILLSAIPCYGILRHQFISVTSIFFEKSCENEHDFTNFLLSVSNPTTGVLHREAGVQSYGDLPVMWLISRLGVEHVLGIVKLLMLEGRILLFSTHASKASCAVLALLSLVPGLYNQGLGYEDHAATQLHAYRWKKFGMPLRVFDENEFLLQPLLVMSQAEAVFNRFKGFIVGTSNAMVSKLHSARLDAVVDLDQCQIDSQRFGGGEDQIDLARVAFEFGPSDANFIEEVLDSLPSKNSPLSTENEFLESSSEWDGSDSWIRKHFQSYLEHFLADASQALHLSREPGGSWMKAAVSGLLSPNRTMDTKLAGYNRAFVQQWMTTRNFQTWQDAYPHGCLQEELDRSQREEDMKLPSDGFFTFTYPNGDSYVGDFIGGKRHGRGTYIEHATGNTYEGEWRNDLRHGKGILTTGASDFLYDGDWLEDRRTGRGHCTIRGRETYTGEWLDNKFHGQGKYCDAEGNVYEGEWVHGRKEGAGTQRRVDGQCYVGEWKGGSRNGMGQCNYADGSAYAGMWRDGTRHGEGVFLTAKKAERYEGLWMDDMKHGWGVLTTANGDVKEGEWAFGEPKDGEWKITYSNGDQFVGHCKEGRPNGHGVCKFANTDVYTGEWEDGLRSGRGVCYYASGEKFDGMWSCNQPLETPDYTTQATYVVPLHEDAGGHEPSQVDPVPSPQEKKEEKEEESSLQAPTPMKPSPTGSGHRKTLSLSRSTPPLPPPVLSPQELSKLSGPSSIIYPSGDSYVGQLVEGRRHGRGTYCERSTGNKYEGEWKDDVRHGHGKLTSGAQDFIYEGDWLNDKRTGMGHCIIRGRESYTGEWVDNKFNGKGKYTDSEGNVYEGEWVNGTKEGAGTYTRVDGEVYVGEWRNGVRCGMGQGVYPDGSMYSGEWREGKRNGEGTLTTGPPGARDKHEGLWSDGKRNGWGIWTSPTGDIVEGEWFLDEPKDGDWKITYSNGDQFVGRCKEGRPNGHGVCKYANGAVYTGEWVDGLRSGQGVCVFANGEVYDGLWEKDHVSLRGVGTLKFLDGRVHEFS